MDNIKKENENLAIKFRCACMSCGKDCFMNCDKCDGYCRSCLVDIDAFDLGE